MRLLILIGLLFLPSARILGDESSDIIEKASLNLPTHYRSQVFLDVRKIMKAKTEKGQKVGLHDSTHGWGIRISHPIVLLLIHAQRELTRGSQVIREP
jgi:hypothetical protein